MIKYKRDIEEFKNFARRVVRTPQSEQSYRNRFGRVYGAISQEGFTKEEILEILSNGSPEEIRELSRFFYRFNGIYSRSMQYYSSLLNYSYMLVPHYDLESNPNVKKIKKEYKAVSKYIKAMNLSHTLAKINEIIFQDGVYFGLLKETEDGRPVFYQLPSRYCRTRLFDENNLPVLELNCTYFDNITNNEIERKSILDLFPKYVQQRYRSKKNGFVNWIEIPPADGGMVFFFNADCVPPFAASLSVISDLQQARDMELKRDGKQLQKLLVQKLPVDKTDGELLFTLEEAAELHEGVSNMVADLDTMDVITTYADIKLENVIDADTAASASTSRIGKYTESVYDELGTPAELFNATSGSTALTYSIRKDISIMFNWSKQYKVWLDTILRRRAKKENFYFSILFFPTTSIFQKEDVDTYLKAAQYGYPKNLVAAALGIDMDDLLQMSHFENKVYKMTEIMVPLQSSYTTPGGEQNSNSSGKSSTTTKTSPDLTNEGGRPEKSVEERTDKTVKNRDGAT